MLSEKLKGENPQKPKKKQDIKLIIIAGVLMIFLLAMLFWIFSPPSKGKDVAKDEQNLEYVKKEAVVAVKPPPLLDENAIERIVKEGENQSVQEAGSSQEIISQLVDSELGASKNSTTQKVHITKNVDNEAIELLKTSKEDKVVYDDMKTHVNSIKNDIVLKDDHFEYKGKSYKKGDKFDNGITVTEIHKASVRFFNGEWEYNLRFEEGIK